MKKLRIPSIVRDVIEIIAAIALLVAGLWFVLGLIVGLFGGRDEDPARLAADVPADGVGRVPVAARYLGGENAGDVPTLEIACETDAVLPEWWDPDSAVLVWSAEPKRDIGCADYNIEAEEEPEWLLDVPMDRWLQDYIHGLSEEAGVPFTLVMAVIEHESHYDPSAVSETGDWGLMQINEVCHGWLGEECGVTDWLDPWQNARAGVFLLGVYYRQYGYDSGTLMAYNMGQPRAEELFRAGVYSTEYSERVMGIRGRMEADNG